jgi:hypothetical protein
LKLEITPVTLIHFLTIEDGLIPFFFKADSPSGQITIVKVCCGYAAPKFKKV